MATAKIVILKNQRKADGTFNVKIRITNERQTAYLSTPHFVGAGQLTRKFELKEKNNPVYDLAMIDLLRIRAELSTLGYRAAQLSARELVEYLKARLSGKTEGIDFFQFAETTIAKMKKENRHTDKYYRSMLNRLTAFCGGRHLLFSEINAKFLAHFEDYLKDNKSGNRKRMITPSGINLYMNCIRHLFILAKKEYNDEDTGMIRIANNPFAKYEMPHRLPVRKKALPVEKIREIALLDLSGCLMNVQTARDMFITSFLLCGTNTADLYFMPPAKNGRFEYERQKTRKKRDDKAFISIGIQRELLPFIDKYRDPTGKRAFNLYKRYNSSDKFVTYMNIYLKRIGEMVGIDGLIFYAARHSWATIARNLCNASMDDVAMCLNHTPIQRVTDIYVKKDFSRIDAINRRVIDKVFALNP